MKKTRGNDKVETEKCLCRRYWNSHILQRFFNLVSNRPRYFTYPEKDLPKGTSAVPVLPESKR